MIKVAITGGIGSGKTTVCKHFYNLGIDIFDSDYHAKLQYQKPEIRKQVIDLFGEEVFDGNTLNVRFLTKASFDDKTKLSKLVEIVTPGVMKDYYDFIIKSTSPFTIFESAILFDYSLDKYFDYVIGVVADEGERIRRVMMRSNKSKEDILKVMINQKNDDFIKKNSDFIIHNNENSLEETVKYIYNNILNM